MVRTPRATPASHARTPQAGPTLRHPELEAAITRFRTHPDPVFRLRLARELALSRSHELRLANRNVVAVVAGWRRQRSTMEGGAQRVWREPCVVLLVKYPRQPGNTPLSDHSTLPRHLLVGAELSGMCELFAVPTEVQLSGTVDMVERRSGQRLRLPGA